MAEEMTQLSFHVELTPAQVRAAVRIGDGQGSVPVFPGGLFPGP